MKFLVVVICVVGAVYAGQCPKTCKEKEAEFDALPPALGRERPICTPEGTFAMKQNRGSMSYCVDECGVRLADYVMKQRWVRHDCSCARDKADAGIYTKHPDCDRYGAYAARPKV
ncbi:uncharacterized protein LOC106175984 isoform X1 [Lingula anatina]|uniref:Uncharacterized protein LOC106175984 isoform X1 n=1 Tax=Lingula anatina TaxID=7574 RepID=A0A1S3JTJ0_LINAN|nr:uncharacterized protein LOC106175984 isoform X1 [Lingula anatina]|eukprot:XP_013413638.1 uncharacterized protein LOC106175984 isoform X1 [Lingula anatina]